MKRNFYYLFYFLYQTHTVRQPIFHQKNGKLNLHLNLVTTKKKINQAIDFVIKNQNPGNKDLRVEILKGFSSEPYHSILGPTKKR